MKRLHFALLALAVFALSSCAASGPESAATTASPSPSTAATVASTAEMEKAVIDIEKKSWEPLKTKNEAEARKFAAPGYRAVYYGEIKDAEETYKDIKDVDLKSQSFSDWKVTFPVKDTAVITYKYEAKGSYKGKDTSGNYAAASVWVNTNGAWKQAVYAEAKTEPPPKK